MTNKEIIKEIFRMANINQPIPEPDEDGIYDFGGITIEPAELERKSIGNNKYKINGYTIPQ
jgi:hypothetical protein